MELVLETVVVAREEEEGCNVEEIVEGIVLPSAVDDGVKVWSASVALCGPDALFLTSTSFSMPIGPSAARAEAIASCCKEGLPQYSMETRNIQGEMKV